MVPDRILRISHTALRLSQAGAEGVHVPADEANIHLDMFNLAHEGCLAVANSLHQGFEVGLLLVRRCRLSLL